MAADSLPPTVMRTDSAELAEVLADHVAERLAVVVNGQGHAVLAVSGGSTPLRFFRALSTRSLPWDRITVTLVDDRAVPHDHPRSNTILVRQNLLQHAASAARFVPLTAPDGTPLAAPDLPGPVDLAHFGMGADGHTASWFPGGDSLAAALSATGPRLLTLSAAGAPEPRVTFGWSALRQAKHAVLHFEGRDKAQTFAQACSPGPVESLPVRRLLQQADVPLTVFTDTPRPESAS
jgi:6-phosphogluconolactonase